MKKSTSQAHSIGAALLAASMTLAAQADNASGDAADNSDSLRVEEVIVTARRFEERLIDLPLSVTAIQGSDIANRNIESVSDLASATPGLYFESFNAGSVGTPVIRGLSQQNLGGFDQQISNNVGRFIDGVYQTNRNSAELELLDIDRVEVIKGPASALYGRATFAGAINIITRSPKDVVAGKASVTLGTDDDRAARLTIEGPIFGSGIVGRLAVGYSSFDGTTRNTEDPDDNVGGFETRSAAGSLIAPIGDSVKLTLSGSWTDQDVEHSAQFMQTQLNCGTSAAGFTYYCGKADWNGGSVSVSPEAFGARNQSSQLTAKLVVELDRFDVISTVGWAKSESELLFDGDLGAGGASHPVCRGLVSFGGQSFPCGLVGVPPVRSIKANAFNGSSNENEDLSFELRLQSTTDSPLQWSVGAFAFDSDATVDTTYGTDSRGLAAGEFFATQVGALTGRTDPIGNPVIVADFDSGVRSQALFGILEYDFTEKLGGSIEGRYEDERKTLRSRVNNFAPSTARVARNWKTFTPRITLDYRLSDDALLYASAAEGIRTGGFNGSFPSTAPNEATYEEESNRTYEVGLKARLPESSLTLMASAFLIDWKDMQISGASSVASFVGSVIQNSGGASSKGVELEARWTPSEDSSLGFGYAYSDPKFDSGVVDRSAAFQCAPDICTLGPKGPIVGGNRLPRTLEHQITADGSITTRFANSWRLTSSLDLAWNGDVFRDSINKLSYGEKLLVGAQFKFQSDALSISVWGKNLLDENYIMSGAFQPRSFTSRAVDYVASQGRRVGVTVSYDF